MVLRQKDTRKEEKMTALGRELDGADGG